MDPNKVLEEIRDIVARIGNADVMAAYELGHELADYAASLDDWLCKGGFPPDAWQPSFRDRPGMVFTDPRPAF